MPIDTAIAWLWILTATLISALGLWLAYRRIGLAASLLYIGGITLLGVSAFKIHPALVRSGLPTDVRKLQDDMAALLAQYSETQRRLDTSRSAADALIEKTKRDQDNLQKAEAQRIELNAKIAKLQEDLAARETEIAKAHENLQDSTKKRDALQKSLTETESESQSRLAALEADRGQLAKVRMEHDSLRAKLESAVAEKHALEANLTLEQSSHKQAQSTIESLRTELSDVRSINAGLAQREQELRSLLERFELSQKQANEEIASLKVKLKSMPTPSLPDVAGNTLSRVFQSTAYFDIEQLPQNELIKGKIGTYYLVRFKNLQTERALTFPPRAFMMTTEAINLKSAVEQFDELVLRKIPKVHSVALYVRGRADGGIVINLPFPKEAEEFRQLQFLSPGDGEGKQFYSRRDTLRITRTVKNENLPNLRAAYLARIIQTVTSGTAPDILGNTPVAGANEAERSADVVVFVAPPS